MTEWRPVESAPAYEISEHGLLRRRVPALTRKAGHMPAGHLKGGYRAYKIATPRGKETHWAHRLVAAAFIGPPPSAHHVIAHNDGQKLNNHYSNIRWATVAENNADTAKHGSLKGTKNPRSKLSECQVRLARDLARQGVKTAFLARQFGVSWSAISDAITGKNWGCVNG